MTLKRLVYWECATAGCGGNAQVVAGGPALGQMRCNKCEATWTYEKCPECSVYVADSRFDVRCGFCEKLRCPRCGTCSYDCPHNPKREARGTQLTSPH